MFTIKPYTYTVKERSWVACQENRNSPSDYYDEDRTGFQILMGEKLIAKGFGYEGAAKAYIRRHLEERGIKEHYAKQMKELKEKMADLKRQIAETKKSEVHELEVLHSLLSPPSPDDNSHS